MATTRNADFQTLLNEYLPNELLSAEMMKRDFFLSNIEIDNNATSGKVIIPWKSSGASSVKFNALTSASDISQSAYLRGSITSLPEVWGSMIFNSADLQDHSGKIPETTFLKILPNEIEDFVSYMRDVVSIQATTGPHFSLALGNGQVGGTIVVNHVDRFVIGQKVTLDDDNSSPGDYYVIAIDVNTGTAGYPGSGTVTLSASRGGAAADISAYTTAQNAKFYHDGIWDGSSATTMTSIKNALLTSALGGSSTLHGKTKATYPVLQSTLVDGSSMTASTVLDYIFDAVTAGRAKNRSNADTAVVSFKHLGSIFKALELQKGPYRVVKEAKTSLYGWTELEVGCVKGNIKIVGVMEMEDSEIFILDMKSMKFYSNGAVFKKQKSPDGNEYTVVRNTTGFQYLLDISFQAELAHLKPSSNIVIHSIPAYT